MMQTYFLRRFPRAGLAYRRWMLLALTLAAWPVFAQSGGHPVPWQINMGRGVTASAHNAYDAHMVTVWICLAIGVIVFGAMGYAIFKFRKSKGAVAAQFSHNTTAEVIWTVIPVILLVSMTIPATHKLIKMYDLRNAEMTVKITGAQWLWEYEYLGENVRFSSRLDRDSDRMRQNPATTRAEIDAHPAYLLNVDNPLVLPVDTKIRFLITADDVIHSWWVPALGWKQDAIPGLVREAWTEILEPGTYRGQCAELCGKDHGFMPVVVQAVSREDFQRWLAEHKATSAPPAPTPVPLQESAEPAPPATDGTPPVALAAPAARAVAARSL